MSRRPSKFCWGILPGYAVKFCWGIGMTARKEKTMTNAKKYAERLDYKQRFMLGHGTDIEATMDIPNEVTAFLYSDFDSMDRHFCRVYDREKMRTTFGCLWCSTFRSGRDPIQQDDIWDKW